MCMLPHREKERKQQVKSSTYKISNTKKVFRRKLIWSVIALIGVLILGMVPVFGVNREYMANFISKGDVFTFLDSMTGGTLSKLSMTGFAIPSYITGSIFLQLLGIVFPKIDKIRSDGEQGRRWFEKLEFIVAVCLTLTYGLVLAIGFGKLGILKSYTAPHITIAVACWTVGTVVTVAVANRITDKGIGNGISMLLGLNILSRVPNDLSSFKTSYLAGKSGKEVLIACTVFAVVVVIVTYIAMYMQCSALYIPIRQSQKEASVLNTMGQIPISAGVANVLPSIYAMTLLSFPAIVASFGKIETNGTVFGKIVDALSAQYWYKPTEWYHVAGFIVYLLFMIGLGFFASHVSFCSEEIADTMKKSGTVIPGINPGSDTVKYLEKCRKVMAMINVIFLVVLTVGPGVLCTKLNITGLTFAGTSIVIIVNTLFDTWTRFNGAYLPVSKKYRILGGKR